MVTDNKASLLILEPRKGRNLHMNKMTTMTNEITTHVIRSNSTKSASSILPSLTTSIKPYWSTTTDQIDLDMSQQSNTTSWKIKSLYYNEQRNKWYAMTAGFVLLLLASTYLAIALSYYMRKNMRDKVKQRRNKRVRDLRNVSMATVWFVFISSVFVLVSLIVYGVLSRLEFCEGFVKTHHVLRIITEVLLSTILWFRQKIFYRHPAMQHLTSKTTTRVSQVFYIIMLISALTRLVFNVFGMTAIHILNPATQEIHCVMTKNTKFEHISDLYVILVQVLLMVSYRVLFLWLLIHPMAKHGRELRDNDIAKDNANGIIKAMRRVLAADCACIAIVVVISVITRIFVRQPVFILSIVWQSELVLGYISIMMSFQDWRLRIFPMCCWSDRNSYAIRGTFVRSQITTKRVTTISE